MAHLLPNLTEFFTPSSLAEARRMLDEVPETTMIMGGGVSLGMIARKRLTHVLSTAGLNLDFIEFSTPELRIGAAVDLGTLHRYLLSSGRSELSILHDAVGTTATAPLRNLITVGGVIAGVGPWSDLPVALLTCETSVIIDGSTAVSLESVMEHGPRQVIGPRSIVTEIRIGIPKHSFGSFRKAGRNATDLAMSSAAVCHRPEDDTVITAIGGIVPRPRMLFRIKTDELDGASGRVQYPRLEEMLAQLDLRRDHRAPDDYRLHLTRRLVLDCIGDALNGGDE